MAKYIKKCKNKLGNIDIYIHKCNNIRCKYLKRGGYIMWCMNCGTELPDKAKFCFNCGEKVDINTINEKSNNLNSMEVNEQNSCIENTYSFKIKDYLIDLPRDTEKLVYLKNNFETLAYMAYKDFSEDSLKDIANIDSMLTYCHSKVERYHSDIAELINEYEEKFRLRGFSHKIKDYINADCYQIVDLIQAIEDRYSEILDSVAEAEEYRRQRKQSRGRWQGGGFGLSGALLGAAEAGALNMVTGAAHSMANGVGNASTRSAAKSQIEKLYKDKKVQESLANAIYNDILNIEEAIKRLSYDEYAMDIPNLYSVDDEKEAMEIYNSIDDLDEITRLDSIIKMLKLDPFEIHYYEKALFYYLDELNGVKEYAEFFEVDYAEARESAINRIKYINDIKSLYGDSAVYIDKILCNNYFFGKLALDFSNNIDTFSNNVVKVCNSDYIYYLNNSINCDVLNKVYDAYEEYAEFGHDTPLLLYLNSLYNTVGFLITNEYIYFKNSNNENKKIILNQLKYDENFIDEDGTLVINNIKTNITTKGYSSSYALLRDFINYITCIFEKISMDTNIEDKVNIKYKYYGSGSKVTGSLASFEDVLEDRFKKNRYYHQIKGLLTGNFYNDIKIILSDFSFDKTWGLLNEISDKVRNKLSNAKVSYAILEDNEKPILLHDVTIFGGAREGFIITNKKIYSKESMRSTPIKINISDINTINFSENYIVINNDFRIMFAGIENEQRNIFIKKIDILINRIIIENLIEKSSDRAGIEKVNNTNIESQKEVKKSFLVDDNNMELKENSELANFLNDNNNKNIINTSINMVKNTKEQSLNLKKECLITKDNVINIVIKKVSLMPDDIKKVLYLNNGNEKSNEKFTNVINSYYSGTEDELPLLLFDNTVFGSAKDGFMVTDKGIYWHNMMSDTGMIKISDIGNILENKGKLVINEKNIEINLVQKKCRQIFRDLIIDIVNNINEIHR